MSNAILRIRFDSARYDELVHGPASLSELGDLEVAVREQQENGLCPVVLAFTVVLPDGTTRRAQTVTSGKLIVALADALRARGVHGPEADISPCVN